MRRSVTYLAMIAALVVHAPVARAQAMHVEQSMTGEMVPFLPPGREPKTGTGVIRGRVYALETGQPIRRAQVRVAGPDIMPKTALADADGRFEFRDLPAGRFTLQATKSGYVPVQFGQTRPYESGRPIELVDKQVIENSDIAMPRGSVIAGRIVDEFGEPMPDVSVTAYRQSWSNGRRRLVPAPGRAAQTNDLGQFRIYGLPPGDYYVSAALRGGAFETIAVDMVRATRSFMDASSASSPASGYAPTYYPGTANPSDAQRITLGVGQENHGADFPLMPVRLAKVTGIVVGSDGKPLAGAMINVTPRDRSEMMLLAGFNSARTNQDGAFTLSGVAPGDYTLQANAVGVTTVSDGANTRVFAVRAMLGGDRGDSETGSLLITVAGEDVANLVLVTSKGGRAAGRVTLDDGAQPPSFASIRITASPIDSDGPPMGFSPGSAVKADGSFELTGLAGARLIRPAALPPGWSLESVRLNGHDITDTGAEFRAGESVTGLEVVLTNRTTTITGGAAGDDGSPLKDFTVVIFPEDEDLWRVPRSRWVTGVRPDQEGRFKVQHMPPGSYHAVAVDYIPAGEWGDPDLLGRLKGRGRRFTLDQGGTQVLELKLAIGY